ncbi:MAG TPA: NAD(P)H-dependent glycerol-3-phosphate dehydrogenase [Bacteroidales bacterium]|nr:NAD(P)H-dependent glycerol-3-phosphate dehydrogenase [Bacteroidales bacterium]
MHEYSNIAVIGGGSWGTALVKLLLENQNEVTWWVRQNETLEHIREFRRNPNYLSYLELDTGRIRLSTDMAEVIASADTLIFAIPAAFLEQSLEGITREQFAGRTVISAIKGMVPGSNLSIGEFFQQQYGMLPENIGIVAGPCHSEEVAMEKLSFLTVAFREKRKADDLIHSLASRYMRLTSTTDVTGIEYAAVLKNIFAIAHGICAGLGYGDNFLSVLTVNSIQEVKRFLNRMNHVERDINDSVYTGDLIVTAYSRFSRNRIFGTMIGKGYSVAFTRIEMKMVAEGYFASRGIREINRRLQVHMPIADAVYNILYEGHSPSLEMSILSERLH